MKALLNAAVLLLSAAICLSLPSCYKEAPVDGTESDDGGYTYQSTPDTDAGAESATAIVAIEINQALSYGLNEDTGEQYMMNNFVAGKTTAVIVRLDGETDTDSASRRELTFTKDGGETATVSPESLTSDKTGMVYTIGAEMLGAGEYEFSLEGVTHTAHFSETRSLRLLLVPIRGNYAGEVTGPADGWQDYAWHLSACYPVAEDNVTVDAGETIDLSDGKYDLCTTEGQWAVR